MDLVDPLAEPCAVCGDKSTGTHYGVVSCNGCKGFFRRTILRNQRFTCRFNKQCVIDKNFRCACRYCRFQKCLSAGMKREAIQFERDTIGSPKKPRRDSPPPIASSNGAAGGGAGGSMGGMGSGSAGERCTDVIDTLMEMEARVNQEMSIRYRNSVIASNGAAMEGSGGASAGGEGSSGTAGEDVKQCSVDDLNEISRTTLLIMVDWARNLAPFPDLSMEDKIILLKNYAPQHLILMPAFRSPDTTRVCLFNNTYVGREQNAAPAELNGFAAFKTSNITPRVLDEIVWPMRQLQMKEEEFVCLKALAFLHPEAKGLSTSSQALIRDARNKVLKALYSFILTQKPEDAPTRYGNILLLAPALKALTQLLIENMTLTKFFGLAEVDSLLSEFILDDLNDQTSAPVSIKEHLVSGPSFTASTQSAAASTSSLAPQVSATPAPASTSGLGGGTQTPTPSSSSAMGGATAQMSLSQQQQQQQHQQLLFNAAAANNNNLMSMAMTTTSANTLMNNNLLSGMHTVAQQQQQHQQQLMNASPVVTSNNHSFLAGMINNQAGLLLQPSAVTSGGQGAQNPFLMGSLQAPTSSTAFQHPGLQFSAAGLSQATLVDTSTTDTIMTIL